MAIEKFSTLKPSVGQGKRIIKSKLLTALGATGVLGPFPQNPEHILERKILLQTPTNAMAGGGGGGVCAAGNTFSMAWATQVVANGGAMPSANTQSAIATFQCGLITDGLSTQMISWNAFVPDSLTAAITPQLKGPSDTTPWTNNGFLTTDLSINGITGNGGNSAYLLPGFKGTDMPSDTSQGITIYMPIITVSAGYDAGASDGTLVTRCWMARKNNNGLTSFGTGGAYPANYAQAASALGAGFFSGSRTASNLVSLYWGNSSNAIALLASSANAGAARQADALNVFSINLVGTSNNFGPTGNTFSFIAFHAGLTLAQTTTLFNRVQTLRQSLGGGFL